jgi:hypothetical protein
MGIALALCAGYYVYNYKKPMQELVYMDFLNNYLLKNKIKEISITKDRRSESFNYRAEILTHDNEKFFMTLGSYENFLAKLDMVQREMGRQPNEFIPVKYSNQSEDSMSNVLLNVMVGSLFLLFFYQIYKNRKGGLGSGGSSGASGKKPTGTGGKDQKGGWF